MKRKFFITVLIALSILILPVSGVAKYMPSISIATSLNLSQNKTITNFDLPLRTSGNFEFNIVPLCFNFNKTFLVETGLSIYANSNSIEWNNTQLIGFFGLEPNLLLGARVKNYQIKAGLGLGYNRYHNEKYFFLSLNGILKQSILINEYLAFTFPFRFSYRQEIFDYRLGFGITYYPKGGAI